MRVTPLILLAGLLVGCGQHSELAAPGQQPSTTPLKGSSPGVPDEARQRADEEMALHGQIVERRGCATLTVRHLRSQAEARAERTGGSIMGWLIEAPQEGRVYACRYTAEMVRRQPPGADDSPERGDRPERVTARVLIPDDVPDAPMVTIQSGEDAESL